MRERNRWTAEEYREFLRTGREPESRPSGVSLEEMEQDDRFERLQKRVARFAATKAAEAHGFPGAEVRLPGDLEKKRKYRNEPVEIGGIRFDSKHEARVYEELMLRVKAGELKAVMVHVPFQLPGGIRYYADFVTLTPDMRIEGVYDAKSEITRKNRVYINKKKQMKSEWGIEIIEV